MFIVPDARPEVGVSRVEGECDQLLNQLMRWSDGCRSYSYWTAEQKPTVKVSVGWPNVDRSSSFAGVG